MLGKKSHHCVAYERNYFVFCELKILVNWIEMTHRTLWHKDILMS